MPEVKGIVLKDMSVSYAFCTMVYYPYRFCFCWVFVTCNLCTFRKGVIHNRYVLYLYAIYNPITPFQGNGISYGVEHNSMEIKQHPYIGRALACTKTIHGRLDK